MTIAEAERIASQPGWKPSIQPEEPKALPEERKAPTLLAGIGKFLHNPCKAR
jgi:hypothetical protein